MKPLKPQTIALLRLLRERPSGVTSLEILDAIGSSRAAARVAELKEAKYVVRTELVRTPTGKRVALYRLDETPLPVPDRGVQTGIGW